MNKEEILGAFSLVNNPIVLSEEEVKDVQKAIKELQQENQELKLELSGYRQAILEDKDMLGLKEESEELKKQLEEKENIACNWKDSCLENAGKIEKLENQQKEFIKYLEYQVKLQEELNDIHLATGFEEILQKYKEIIGDNK